MTMLTTRDVKGVGFEIPRADAPEKVTGRIQYVADLNPRGLLHARLLRSPHAHARIVRIDASKAKALPGVRSVLTAADIPHLERSAASRYDPQLAGWVTATRGAGPPERAANSIVPSMSSFPPRKPRTPYGRRSIRNWTNW